MINPIDSDKMASTRFHLGFSFALLCVVLCFYHTKAEHIVLTPMFGGSHYLLFRRIGEELGNRGHKVNIMPFTLYILLHVWTIYALIFCTQCFALIFVSSLLENLQLLLLSDRSFLKDNAYWHLAHSLENDYI